MRKLVPVLAGVLLLAAGAGAADAAGALQDATVYACAGGGKLTRVSLDSPRPCPSGTPVRWAAQVPATPVPSPSPSPAPTTPVPSPTATGAACTVQLGSNCGPYLYAGIPMS